MSGIGDLFGGSDDLPVVEAQNPSRRADPIADATGGTDKQKMMAASLMTQNWAEPELSKRGLLGA